MTVVVCWIKGHLWHPWTRGQHITWRACERCGKTETKSTNEEVR